MLLRTDRLLLRPWKDEDFAPYARITADPRVREFYPSVLTREESDAEIRKFQAAYEKDGYTFFAAEFIPARELIGFLGMLPWNDAPPALEQPVVKLGWLLAPSHWGKGLATEGACSVIQYAFETLNLPQIVATTTPANFRSRHVMEKLGMERRPELDFEHPRIPEGHPLRAHITYTLRRQISAQP